MLLLLFVDVLETLLSSMFKSPGRGTHLEALPPLDEASQTLSACVLTCLAHYFSWAPLSATLTPQLLSTVFHFAAFGCEGKTGRTGSSSTSSGVCCEFGLPVGLCSSDFSAVTENAGS